MSGADFAEGIEILVDPRGFEDWAGLHALLVASFAYMEGRIDPPSSLTRMPPEVLAEKAGSEHLLLAFAGQRLVGCGFLAERPDAIYLGKLAVAADFRRRGLLRRFVEQADMMARRLGKAELELETRIELVENHRTFAALGFIKVGEKRHVGYDRSTSITMRRPVPQWAT